MDGESILGRRVRLSPLGIAARIITRGATTGVILGFGGNGEASRLYVLRDGLKHPAWYDADFWEPDDTEQSK